MTSIAIDLRPVADLAPYARNARKHSDAAVARLVAIIEEMGWTGPILVDEDGIVAGHKRRLAALSIYGKGGTIRLPSGQALPPGLVPTLDVSGWSEAQRRAYILADNQTTLESDWDDGVLRLELSWLEGAGFDMGLTGFDGDALAAALGLGGGDAEKEPDPLKVKLADRFGVPPFSILRASEGWWQDRKRAWLALGIQSELGRGDASTYNDGASLGGGGLADQVAAKATARRKATATPGGSAMPSADYSKNKARGDGRGRAMNG